MISVVVTNGEYKELSITSFDWRSPINHSHFQHSVPSSNAGYWGSLGSFHIDTRRPQCLVSQWEGHAVTDCLIKLQIALGWKEMTNFSSSFLGQALGGIFAAVANIISIFLAANELTSALIYFTLGSTSLFISFLVVIFLPKLIFFKFHSGEKGIYRWVENYPPEALIRPEVRKTSSWIILKKVGHR